MVPALVAVGREGGLAHRPHGTSEQPLPYRRLLADATVLCNYLCHFAANWSLALTLTWVPSYLESGLGIDPINTGRLFVLFVVVTTPLSLFVAWWSQRLVRQGVPSRQARGVFVSLCLIASGLLSAALVVPTLAVPARIVCLTLSGGAGFGDVLGGASDAGGGHPHTAACRYPGHW